MVDSLYSAITNIEQGQSQKEVTANEGFDRISAMVAATLSTSITSGNFVPTSVNPNPQWQANVRFVLTGTPGVARIMECPVGASFCKLFVVQNDADDQVTVQVDDPAAGTTVVLQAGESRTLYSDGTDVIALVSDPSFLGFDIGGFFGGLPTANALLLKFVAVRAFTLPQDLTGSRAHSEVAANAQADFDLQKNGSSIGTMRFAASAQTATFIHSTATSFAVGDRFHVIAPNPQDANLADVAATFLGTRD